jgi:hypothetical protein
LWYLQEFAKHSIIPHTFIIKNQIHSIQSKTITEVKNLLLQTSKSFVNLLIKDLKPKEDSLFTKHLDSVKYLLYPLQSKPSRIGYSIDWLLLKENWDRKPKPNGTNKKDGKETSKIKKWYKNWESETQIKIYHRRFIPGNELQRIQNKKK